MKRLWRSPWFRALSGVALAPVCTLLVAAFLAPLPAGLGEGASAAPNSVRFHDAHGRLLGEVRADGGGLSAPVTLDALPPQVPLALLAAEDARFYRHPGIDPIAMARALGQALWHRRIVSGASTITQQLVKNVTGRPRTLGGKLTEMAVALKVEAKLDKQRILQEYLSRVEFGPNVRGIEAASRLYFDKPAHKLSLAEAAALAALPRGPSLYDPRRGSERLERRRNRVLERMLDSGFASADAVERARAEPIVLHRGAAEGGAPHFVRALLSGALVPELSGQELSEIATTLDLALQREVVVLTRQTRERLAAVDASAASVLVVDNSSGDILAYVGSPDFADSRALGQNDGVRARRQPGSTLKPFVYAAGMDRLGLGVASLLPDVELHLATPEGDYSPRNYDGRYHGPVRLREALGNSYNVPAVWVAQEAGPARVLDLLRRVGFSSLDRSPEHYGAAIALGDGEVSLAELVNAYAALSRGGLVRPLRAVKRARLASGAEIALPPLPERRALPAESAALLGDVLSDPNARAAAFGRGSALELPFPVAVKTGTSKGYRDNWAVGYTRAVTVGVWVGNFDGRPMTGSSGVTGAAPLFRDVMLAAMRERQPEPLIDSSGLRQLEVCALSGDLPGADCPHRVRERFAPGREPRESCAMHVSVPIDPATGLRAGPGCSGSKLELFESYPDTYLGWARGAGRPLGPEGWSPRCPGAPDSGETRPPSIAYPFEGARFVHDPGVSPAAQGILLRARVPGGAARVRFVVDGKPVGSSAAPHSIFWPLHLGEHRVTVETPDGRMSKPVRFVVE
ncbi:MAG: penicillin-binding protein 1C [Polyangiaceae bacterium]|nr:penicillin-binding protein 1C [Polyangiaceae bacterium]MCL4751641.1 penicillin-binding protein 1C [Myxococcales bacterium]